MLLEDEDAPDEVDATEPRRLEDEAKLTEAKASVVRAWVRFEGGEPAEDLAGRLGFTN